ncbi:unnamed protein product [Prunus armeniaca]|uniref:Uncharacterized protein n=1 Tax=Prunus armeniaca TaxID=36596 RepID=A0A6J5W4R5_PRUAR|nr:unnamed protein product [Prunus armeniaca]
MLRKGCGKDTGNRGDKPRLKGCEADLCSKELEAKDQGSNEVELIEKGKLFHQGRMFLQTLKPLLSLQSLKPLLPLKPPLSLKPPLPLKPSLLLKL